MSDLDEKIEAELQKRINDPVFLQEKLLLAYEENKRVVEENKRLIEDKKALAETMQDANRLPRTMNRKAAFKAAWVIARNGGYEKKAMKAVELFGSRWGTHTQTSFERHTPTVEEINAILVFVYREGRDKLYSLDTAIKTFASHVQMSDYPDYEIGYRSGIFKNDVCAVLNAGIGEQAA